MSKNVLEWARGKIGYMLVHLVVFVIVALTDISVGESSFYEDLEDVRVSFKLSLSLFSQILLPFVPLPIGIVSIKIILDSIRDYPMQKRFSQDIWR